MPSDLPKITTRTDDDELKPKLKKLARKEGRTLSRQVEYILKRYVSQYERTNGKIDIKDPKAKS